MSDSIPNIKFSEIEHLCGFSSDCKVVSQLGTKGSSGQNRMIPRSARHEGVTNRPSVQSLNVQDESVLSIVRLDVLSIVGWQVGEKCGSGAKILPLEDD